MDICREKIIIAAILIMAIPIANSATQTNIFSLELNVSDSGAELEQFNITKGTPSNLGEGEYRIILLNNQESELYSENFSVPMRVTHGDFSFSSRTKLIRVPYQYNAYTAVVKKKDEKLVEHNIAKKECIPNDNKCPEYCEGKEIDSDCTKEESKKGIFTKIINWLSQLFV